MKQVLKEISKTAINLGDFEFSKEQVTATWLGREPASHTEIADAEKRLGITLPDDYKEFLMVCNGFHAANTVEPTFLSIDKIGYLEMLDPGLSRIWIETGNTEIGNHLRKSIFIGGLKEEQHFLLIPPTAVSGWRYWKFASWIPGEKEYKDLLSYWNDVLEFNKEQLHTK